MRFVVVTGMSGAGKSTALKMLEDVGYFCADNLPIPLILKFTQLLIVPNPEISKIALGIDIRSGQNFSELETVLGQLDDAAITYEVLFLEASDEILIKRYKETRRQHPLTMQGSVEQGLMEERVKLEFLKKKADYILDTSQMLTRDLKAEIGKIFVHSKEFKNLYITILSFGFKYGIPNDADLVFDVRFLPNPYYEESLRDKSGNDKEVRDFVMQNEKATMFLEKLKDMITFLIPNYTLEGKHQLVIAIGCTGGKHRSVTLANELFGYLQLNEDYGVNIKHRDKSKDEIIKAR